MWILLGFSFLAGIFTALSPCILPVLPAILAAGVSKGRLRPLGMILGLVISFSFFTLALTWIVHETGLPPPILRYGAIALIFLFGLVMVFPKLSDWFAKITAPIADFGQKLQEAKPRSGFSGGVLFGFALGLLWTPCAGPILAAITTLAATRSVNATAVFMTLAYSLGAAIPMFLLAYGSSKLIQSSRRLSRYTEQIRQFFGVLMLLFALLLTFNWDMLLNEKLARLVPDFFLETNLPIEDQLKSIQGQGSLMENVPAPELAGIVGWINSPPLTLSELKGKVILIDFWTYSCINCLRTLPYLKNWDRDYQKEGLVIIGVHTPEFEFEKEYDNVKKATEHLGIHYPVALDNDYGTWNAYHNHYWPAHFLIDQEGKIRMVHFGEGAYVDTENAIRKLLGFTPLKMEEPKRSTRAISPETYLGLARGKSYSMSIIPGKAVDYHYESPLKEDQVGLKGLWKAEEEYIVSESDESTLDYNFLATRVYLVLAGSSPTPLEVFLDGKPSGRITVNGDRKYDIVSASYGRHQLSLKVPKGIKAYAFTFGDE